MTKEILIKRLEEINKNDFLSVGGKGASLGEMLKINVSVPPGFVVLSSVFARLFHDYRLLHSIKEQLCRVDYNNLRLVERSSRQIRSLIDNVKMPADLQKAVKYEFKRLNCTYVAIRSSATAEDSLTASWAGVLESYVNTSEAVLFRNIKNCWSSLFSPRAIFYLKEKNLSEESVAVAVVVQKMIESEISGTVFTMHPVFKDKTMMLIESGFGLGEAIVSGSIIPDSYVVDKEHFSVKEININAQTVMLVRDEARAVKWKKVAKIKQGKKILSDEQIKELAKICLTIEKHYQKPQDIEWAYAKGKFFILQSRPITTL